MNSKTLAGMTAALLLSAGAVRADVSINNQPTSNMSCAGGVCTATAQKAVLNVTDLANMLAGGDVAVKTGTLAKDIDIDQPLTWTSASRLTLDAQQSVQIDKQVTVAGQGALTVTTNDTGGAKQKTKTGEFIVVPERGSVQFWDSASSLMIDGQQYTLVYDIKTLAADIAANPSGSYALAKPYDASVDGTYSASPITTTFMGTLEGLGNEIMSLTASFTANAQAINRGLFSLIGPSGTVRDLKIAGVKLLGSGSISGALGVLAGGNEGVIERCSADGLINVSIGKEIYAGGLIGGNDGTVRASYSEVTIKARSTLTQIGGLAGFNAGLIVLSYARGKLVGHANDPSVYMGGLIGPNLGIIENTYSRAFVHQANGCCQSLGGLVAENRSGARILASYATGTTRLASRNGEGDVGGFVGTDSSERGNIGNSYWNLDRGVGDPAQGAGNVRNDPGITGLTTTQLKSQLPKGFDARVWGLDPRMNGGFPYLLTVSAE